MSLASEAVTLGRFPAILGSIDVGIYNVEGVGSTTASAYFAALAIYTAQQTPVMAGKVQIVPVTVASTATTGTATVTAGATILGIEPSSNEDQFVNNVAISSTTLTVTLHAAATATTTFNVVVLNV